MKRTIVMAMAVMLFSVACDDDESSIPEGPCKDFCEKVWECAEVDLNETIGDGTEFEGCVNECGGYGGETEGYSDCLLDCADRDCGEFYDCEWSCAEEEL